jgi:hypothetical protein
MVYKWAQVTNSRQQSCKLASRTFLPRIHEYFRIIIREFVADFYVSSERIISASFFFGKNSCKKIAIPITIAQPTKFSHR